MPAGPRNSVQGSHFFPRRVSFGISLLSVDGGFWHLHKYMRVSKMQKRNQDGFSSSRGAKSSCGINHRKSEPLPLTRIEAALNFGIIPHPSVHKPAAMNNRVLTLLVATL